MLRCVLSLVRPKDLFHRLRQSKGEHYRHLCLHQTIGAFIKRHNKLIDSINSGKVGFSMSSHLLLRPVLLKTGSEIMPCHDIDDASGCVRVPEEPGIMK